MNNNESPISAEARGTGTVVIDLYGRTFTLAVKDGTAAAFAADLDNHLRSSYHTTRHAAALVVDDFRGQLEAAGVPTETLDAAMASVIKQYKKAVDGE